MNPLISANHRFSPLWGMVCSLLLCSLFAPFAADAEEADPLLGLFPDSKAPTFFEKQSELVLERGFCPWERNSQWHPEINEEKVYHCRMQHKSTEERSWGTRHRQGRPDLLDGFVLRRSHAAADASRAMDG